MATPKPTKTLADYMVIGISPMLVMLLVGSLCFFLIEVFFRGEAQASVRWVMFWYLIAVVLVSRIGIEQGVGYAAGYGFVLALATWCYLMRVHPAFLLGMVLLGIVWWCAHKLTWDCTLIDEDEDASGGGLLETAGKEIITRADAPVAGQKKEKKKSRQPHSPGLWVVYFSLAALPLFGIGQMLLPGEAVGQRRAGFIFLLVYVAAALGLLLTTSFLGLRRYLRQRWVEMPPVIAFGWVRFGVVVVGFVLIGALLLPRPGVSAAWGTLEYQIDHRLRQASDYAMRFSPHGKGEGREGNQTRNSEPLKTPNAEAQPAKSTEPPERAKETGGTQKQPGPSRQPAPMSGNKMYSWLKNVLMLVVGVLLVWWIWRKRELLLQMARSAIEAIRRFFRDLFGWTVRGEKAEGVEKILPAKRNLFASYVDPFISGKQGTWTHAELVLYSYEALRAWAGEHEVAPKPEQTAREFCEEVGGKFPEIGNELRALSFFYGHAAYGVPIPAKYDLEPVKSVWRFLTS